MIGQTSRPWNGGHSENNTKCPLPLPHHHRTTPHRTMPHPMMVTQFSLPNLQIMVVLCYSCSIACKSHKGLENHLKSCPACLDELGISRSSNWGVKLGLSSVTTSSKAINHHLFPVEIDTKLAAKRPVEVMWHDENTRQTHLRQTLPSNPSNLLLRPPLEELASIPLFQLSIFVEQRKLT